MKKIITTLFIFVAFFNIVNANKQNEVNQVFIDEVSYSLVNDPYTGETHIRPRISVKWEDKLPSLIPDETEGVVDGASEHPIVDYKVYMKNLTTQSDQRFLGRYTEKNIVLGLESNLKAGSLYEFEIIPTHTHDYAIDEDGNTETREAPYIDGIDHETAIALTDLDVEVTGEGNELEVTWEDLGTGIDYDILYEKGDIKDTDNMNGKVEDVKTNTTSYIDPKTLRRRLKYTISNDSISAGQIYSVYVNPDVLNIDGVDVIRNFNPKIATGSTEVPLEIYEQGEDYLKLVWWGIESTLGSGSDSYKISEVRMLKKDGEAGSENVIAKIHGEDAVDIGYYTTHRPDKKTFYKMILTYSKKIDGVDVTLEMASNWREYNPSAVKITPIKPEIPKINELLSEDDNTVPNIESYKGSLHVKDNKINFVWSSFRHKDYVNNTDEIITNLDVYYDLWVTDDVSQIYGSVLPTITSEIYGETFRTSSDAIKNTNDEIIGFREEIDQYIDVAENEDGTINFNTMDVEPNKLYYIKIRARRVMDGDTVYSQPNIISVYYDYDGNIYTPQVLSENLVKQRNITQESASFEWKNKWYEITDKNDVDRKWYSKLYTDNTTISFSQTAGFEEVILDSEFDVNNIKSIVGPTFDTDYLIREINLGEDINYELKYLKYENVLEFINEQKQIDSDYDIKSYISEQKDIMEGWEDITPIKDTEDASGNTFYYNIEDLEANTSYLTLFRTYRNLPDDSKIYSSYPSKLVLTTNKEDDVIITDPKVTHLLLEDKKDTEIKVKWLYNMDFEYDLFYSEFEDINTAEQVEYKIPEDSSDPNYPMTGKMFKANIIDLFPKTDYYFWIKSKQVSGEKESEFSNALHVVTENVLPDPIYPPEAIGIAYGDDAVTQDSITIEWLRDEEDFKWEKIKEDRSIIKEYFYEVEAADNINFLDSNVILVGDSETNTEAGAFEVISKDSVKYKNLEANRKYYFRVRTVLKVTEKEGEKEIIKKSEYSAIRIFKTDFGSEYDGNIDPSKIEDKEKAVDMYEDEKWTYIVLDKHKFSNDILSTKNNYYEIDMEDYEREDVKEREIILPNDIYETYKQEKIKLKVKSDEETYEFDLDKIPTLKHNKLKNIKFNIKEDIIDINKDVISTEKNVAIILEGKNIQKEIEFLEDDYLTLLDIDYYNDNLKPYIYDKRGKEHEVKTVYYDIENEKAKIRTNILGTPVIVDEYRYIKNTVDLETREDINNVLREVNIADVNDIDYDNIATNDNLLKIFYGIIMNRDIHLKKPIPLNWKIELKRAGFEVNINYLTKNRLRASIKRFLEIKYGESLPYYEINFKGDKDLSYREMFNELSNAIKKLN